MSMPGPKRGHLKWRQHIAPVDYAKQSVSAIHDGWEADPRQRGPYAKCIHMSPYSDEEGIHSVNVGEISLDCRDLVVLEMAHCCKVLVQHAPVALCNVADRQREIVTADENMVERKTYAKFRNLLHVP